MFEQAQVLLRSSQAHGHLVERHAVCSFVEHPARDLERFARFTRRRKETDVAGARPLRRRLRVEDVPSQAPEIRGGRCIVVKFLDVGAVLVERTSGRLIAGGTRHAGFPCVLDHRLGKLPFGHRVERNVEHAVPGTRTNAVHRAMRTLP